MGVSQIGQAPSIIGICSYCVLDRPVFEQCQTLLHPELTPGGLSSQTIVSTTRSLTAPSTPINVTSKKTKTNNYMSPKKVAWKGGYFITVPKRVACHCVNQWQSSPLSRVWLSTYSLWYHWYHHCFSKKENNGASEEIGLSWHVWDVFPASTDSYCTSSSNVSIFLNNFSFWTQQKAWVSYTIYCD